MRNFRYWAPVLLWMSVIFLMSTAAFSSQNTSLIIEPILRFLAPSLSSHKVEIIHDLIRKAGHVTEYFVLGILLFRAFRDNSTEKRMWRWALFSVLLAALYAAGDEFHQSFVSTRTPSLSDVGIDATAAILAQGASLLWRHRRHR
jgi:VanZ family protein